MIKSNTEESQPTQTGVPQKSMPSERINIKVEDVYEKIGGFSRFQFMVTVILLSLEIPAAMIFLSPILTTTNQVDFYCMTHNGSTLISREELCEKGKCDGEIRSKPPFKSIVQEWNLICAQSWVPDTLISVFMVGSAVGPLLIAQVADRCGRKPAFYLVCLLMTASGIFSSLATSPLLYGVSRLVSGIGAGGSMVAHMNYLMEFLTPSWRVICGCVGLWPLGEMLLALAGYLFPSWRDLAWISVAPAAALLLTFPLLPESPRWLLCKKRTKQAQTVFNRISKCNNAMSVDDETMQALQMSILKSGNIGSEETNDPTAASTSAWKVFKEKRIFVSISIFFIAWFANSLTYFGISYNMKNITGNPYLNVFLLGLLDWPAELFGMYFSNRYGRKLSFIGFLIVSAVFLVGVFIVHMLGTGGSDNWGLIILVLCLGARFFNETSFAIQTCFTGESFPTIIRSMCFSICTVASSLGGVIAPQMVYIATLWAPFPYIIFGLVCVTSALFSMNLKETKKKPLQDLKEGQA